MSILTLESKKEEKGNFQSKKKKEKENFQSKKKGRKENSRSRIERKQKKCAERSLDQTISEQYRIVTK